MYSVFLQALALASVGIISPGSITLMILLLMSDKGLRTALAFAGGYLLMYSAIGIAVLVFGVSIVETNQATVQSPTTSIVLVGVGVLLLLLSLRSWRQSKTQTETTDTNSRFAKLVAGITPLKAFGLAATISLVNVKNLTIFVSAVSVLLLSTLPLSTTLPMLIPLVLTFCTSILAPLTIYLVFPRYAADYLNRIKTAISRYSSQLSWIVTLALGCFLLYRGLSGLL